MREFGKNNPAWRPIAHRFWEKVNKAGPTVRAELGPCWLWEGAHCKYGTTWLNGKHELAHRVAWYLETGSMPTPCALHKCDTPLCVRFSHLFEGTLQDNVDDRESKGRNRPARGEAHKLAKLCDEDVRDIRRLLAKGESQRSIGKMFGVSHDTVGKIYRGRTWKETIL